MTDIYRTDLYSSRNDGIYAFREAFKNASGLWDIRDVDEARIKDGKVVPDVNASFIIAANLNPEAAQDILYRWDRALQKSSAAVVKTDALEEGACPHYSRMAV